VKGIVKSVYDSSLHVLMNYCFS